MKTEKNIEKHLDTRNLLKEGGINLEENGANTSILLTNLNKTLPALLEIEEEKKKGSYGICVDCKEKIPEERLQIISTIRCIECQTKFEKNLENR